MREDYCSRQIEETVLVSEGRTIGAGGPGTAEVVCCHHGDVEGLDEGFDLFDSIFIGSFETVECETNGNEGVC